MDRQRLVILVFIVLLAVFLPVGFQQSCAQAQDVALAQDSGQPAPCDGTGGNGSVQGIRRSTSNCDRAAAAARMADRKAAFLSGKPSPDQAAPALKQSTPDGSGTGQPATETTAPETSVPDDNGGNNE